MNPTLALAAVIGLLLASARLSPLSARLIAADDFDYDSATLTAGLNGGLGWAEPWTGENFLTAGSLAFAGMSSRGHKLTTNPAPGREAAKCSFRAISPTDHADLVEDGKFGRDNTTLWIGFLINAPTGLSTGYGGLSLYDDEKQQVFIGDTGASDVYAIERSGQLQRFSSVRADASVHFLVCRIVFQPGDDQLDFWIDPLPGSKEPSQESAAASATVRDFRFNRVRLCSAPVPLNFDNLHLGTTFADLTATPPGSAPGIQPLAHTGIGMNWTILLLLAIALVILGGLLLAILFWLLARRKHHEPPLIR